MLDGKTKLLGFFAEPAEHSQSPAMYNYSFEQAQLNYCYLAFPTNQKTLSAALEAMRTLNMLGGNLSMPNKQLACQYLDKLSPEATLLGAVNTIVNQEGHLVGYNTDGLGLVDALEAQGLKVAHKKFIILGSGGAATAVIVQLALSGAAEICIYARASAKRTQLAQIIEKLKKDQQSNCDFELEEFAALSQINVALANYDYLINATNIGMGQQQNQSPLPATVTFPKKLVVVDLIYEPRTTQLLQQAKQQNIRCFNGLGMLLYQGAAAFHLWTGLTMPVQEVARKIFNEEL